jgi:hypothetical protein
MSSHPSTFAEYETSYRSFLKELAEVSPTMAEACFLKGSAPASIQFFQHCFSMDADFQTKQPFDVETILNVREELREGYGDRLSEFMCDGEYGVFMGAIEGANGEVIEIDLMSSYEHTDPSRFSKAGKLEGFDCMNKGDYIKEKASGCLVTRCEPKDLFHLAVMCRQDPIIDNFVKNGIGNISKNKDTAEALSVNLKAIREELENPDELLSELLEPREGKSSVTPGQAIDLADDLLEIVSPNLEQTEPEHNFEMTVSE